MQKEATIRARRQEVIVWEVRSGVSVYYTAFKAVLGRCCNRKEGWVQAQARCYLYA